MDVGNVGCEIWGHVTSHAQQQHLQDPDGVHCRLVQRRARRLDVGEERGRVRGGA